MADALEKTKLKRLTRADLDFAFRTRGEATLMRVAYYGRRIARVAVRAGGLSLAAAVVAGMIFPRFGIIVGMLGVLGMGSLLVGAAARVLGVAAVVPERTTRALRLQQWSRTDDTGGFGGSTGARTMLRGRVMTALRTVKTLDGKPAVFIRRRITRGGRGGELNQAEDFLVDDDSGSPARVAVECALFLDPPTPVFGSWGIPLEFFRFLPSVSTPTEVHEAVLFPGDQIEVIGRVETVVDPSVTDHLGRQTPVIRVFTGTPEEPVLLRTLT